MMPDGASNWPARTTGAKAPPALKAHEIHVWAARLDVSPATREHLAATLSLSEQERAARFHFERHRQRFTTARGLLRVLLGHYLERDPRELEFGYGAAGKPSLSGSASDKALQFNLTHSEDLALVAVTDAGQVGIDVERIRPMKDADEFVARFFSEREHASFKRLPESQKPTAFFTLWTRKEAWLKATGEGIAQSLNRVEVSFLPGEPARLLAVPDSLSQGSTWDLVNLSPAPGFAAALAIAASAPEVQCWWWRPHAEPGTGKD